MLLQSSRQLIVLPLRGNRDTDHSIHFHSIRFQFLNEVLPSCLFSINLYKSLQYLLDTSKNKLMKIFVVFFCSVTFFITRKTKRTEHIDVKKQIVSKPLQISRQVNYPSWSLLMIWFEDNGVVSPYSPEWSTEMKRAKAIIWTKQTISTHSVLLDEEY